MKIHETSRYIVSDSDGNTLSEHDNVDQAIRAAATRVCEDWPDYEVATISGSCCVDANEIVTPICTVERAGPKGSRSVRVALAGAGWVCVTTGMSSAE